MSKSRVKKVHREQAILLCDASASEINGNFARIGLELGLGDGSLLDPHPAVALADLAYDAASETTEGRCYLGNLDFHLLEALAAQMLRDGWSP